MSGSVERRIKLLESEGWKIIGPRHGLAGRHEGVPVWSIAARAPREMRRTSPWVAYGESPDAAAVGVLAELATNGVEPEAPNDAPVAA